MLGKEGCRAWGSQRLPGGGIPEQSLSTEATAHASKIAAGVSAVACDASEIAAGVSTVPTRKGISTSSHSRRGLALSHLCWFLGGLVPDDNVSVTGQQVSNGRVLKTPSPDCFPSASRGQAGGDDRHGPCVPCCIELAGNEDSSISRVTLGMVPVGVMDQKTGHTHFPPSMPFFRLCHVAARHPAAAPACGRRTLWLTPRR